MRTLLFSAFAAASVCMANAQTVLEAKGFDSTEGFTIAALNGQLSWLTISTFNVTNNAFQAGDQSVFLDSAPITTAWAWKTFGTSPWVNSGVVVTDVYVRYDDSTPSDRTDNTAFGIEAWANDGSNRFGTLAIGGDGYARVKAGFNDTTINTDTTLTVHDTWYRLTLVTDVVNKKVRGFIDGTQIGAELTNTDAGATNVSDVDLVGMAFGGYGVNFGISSGGGFNGAFFDGYQSKQYNAKSIRCKAILNNCLASPAGRPVAWELRDGGGNTVASGSSTLDAAGEFSINNNTLTGAYSLVVKPARYLAKAINITIDDFGVFNAVASCIPGDCNDDNEVGPGDFTILSNAFGNSLGDPGYNVAADINCDDEVGPGDFTILSANFGLQGD